MLATPPVELNRLTDRDVLNLQIARKKEKNDFHAAFRRMVSKEQRV
jgi:hypothetical protein